MPRLLTIQGLLTILADACLSGLLVSYVRFLPKREQSANHAILLPLLMGVLPVSRSSSPWYHDGVARSPVWAASFLSRGSAWWPGWFTAG